MIKRFFLAWIAQDVVEEVVRLRGELKIAEKHIKELKDDVLALEADRKDLLDSLLQANGIPMLYKNEEPKPTLKKLNPLAGVTRGGDFSRIATMLENEAFSDVEFKR